MEVDRGIILKRILDKYYLKFWTIPVNQYSTEYGTVADVFENDNQTKGCIKRFSFCINNNMDFLSIKITY
jgi:hypothetical protein